MLCSRRESAQGDDPLGDPVRGSLLMRRCGCHARVSFLSKYGGCGVRLSSSTRRECTRSSMSTATTIYILLLHVPFRVLHTGAAYTQEWPKSVPQGYLLTDGLSTE